MTSARTLVVGHGASIRLDAFVRGVLAGTSRRLVRVLIEEGRVRVNGRPATKGTHVTAGDAVVVPLLEPLAPEPDTPLTVLYEDARVVAVDKPGGVAGHALDPRERGSVAAALLARYPELARVGDPLAPGFVHRLDTGTSGVLLAARTPEACADLRAFFRRRTVHKRYVALVAGVPRPGDVIDTPLAHDPRDRRRMRAARSGERAWPARTLLVGVSAFRSAARVELEIETGVTHQVRVHLALAGHPVFGDALYGGPPAALGPGRHALHASRVAIAPWQLAVDAPLPEDLDALARALGTSA